MRLPVVASISYVALFVLVNASLGQNLLDSERWLPYFKEHSFEQHANQLTKENFWDYDRKHTYYTNYPLFIVFVDGSSELIQWQYDGLDNLFRKQHTLVGEDMERIEKGNIAYMVFDKMLLKNSMPENMLEGDFMIVHKKGPLSIYKEFYVPESDKSIVQTFWSAHLLGEKIDNLYLGKFTKKFSRILEESSGLSSKIKERILGYANLDDLPNIAGEYNVWVEENYPYRFADHVSFFWQTPSYLSQD